MDDILAGFVLAAGAGQRLRPLTHVRPKALCPVGNVPLVDLAIAGLERVVDDIAVNVHHHRRQLETHLEGRVHVSVEVEQALGTAGALGRARGWLDGRGVLVVNADAWHREDLRGMVEGWDRERIRLGVVGGGPLEVTSRVVAALMPWTDVRALDAVPAGLYEALWRDAARAGRLEVIDYEGPFVDCATPADYLRANLLASGGTSVIHPAAVVEGRVERSVVWDTGRVHAAEHLRDAIRIGTRLTVLVR